jgi:hypothetical protein
MNSPDLTPSVQPSSWENRNSEGSLAIIILLQLLLLLLPLGSVEFLVNAAPPRKIFFVQEAAREKVGNICGELVGGDLIER